MNSEFYVSKDVSQELKGLAILMVIFGHILAQYSRFGTPFGGIGVGIFLMLSGYGLKK